MLSAAVLCTMWPDNTCGVTTVKFDQQPPQENQTILVSIVNTRKYRDSFSAMFQHHDRRWHCLLYTVYCTIAVPRFAKIIYCSLFQSSYPFRFSQFQGVVVVHHPWKKQKRASLTNLLWRVSHGFETLSEQRQLYIVFVVRDSKRGNTRVRQTLENQPRKELTAILLYDASRESYYIALLYTVTTDRLRRWIWTASYQRTSWDDFTF